MQASKSLPSRAESRAACDSRGVSSCRAAVGTEEYNSSDARSLSHIQADCRSGFRQTHSRASAQRDRHAPRSADGTWCSVRAPEATGGAYYAPAGATRRKKASRRCAQAGGSAADRSAADACPAAPPVRAATGGSGGAGAAAAASPPQPRARRFGRHCASREARDDYPYRPRTARYGRLHHQGSHCSRCCCFRLRCRHWKWGRPSSRRGRRGRRQLRVCRGHCRRGCRGRGRRGRGGNGRRGLCGRVDGGGRKRRQRRRRRRRKFRRRHRRHCRRDRRHPADGVRNIGRRHRRRRRRNCRRHRCG